MKKIFVAVVAAATCCAPALAAPPADTMFNWTGFYAGANLGYSLGRSDTSASFFNLFNNTTPGPILLTTRGTLDMNGAIGGLQIGGNWQNGNWVLGLEADLQTLGQKGSKTFTCPAASCSSAGNNTDLTSAVADHNQKLDWFGTLRGRLGVTASPTILTYVTGGLAWGRIKTNDTFTANGTAGLLVAICPGPTCGSPVPPSSTTKTGWTIGIGAEQRLSGNWSYKVEYLYMDLGRVNNFGIFPTGNVSTNSVPIQVNLSSKITDNILRIGLNYQY
jgi:outer membrane immunogenic protein